MLQWNKFRQWSEQNNSNPEPLDNKLTTRPRCLHTYTSGVRWQRFYVNHQVVWPSNMPLTGVEKSNDKGFRLSFHLFHFLQGRWFYALLVCLEKPLLPETTSLLRTLARLSATLRASLVCFSHFFYLLPSHETASSGFRLLTLDGTLVHHWLFPNMRVRFSQWRRITGMPETFVIFYKITLTVFYLTSFQFILSFTFL